MKVSKYLFKGAVSVEIAERGATSLNDELKSVHDELFTVVAPGKQLLREDLFFLLFTRPTPSGLAMLPMHTFITLNKIIN